MLNIRGPKDEWLHDFKLDKNLVSGDIFTFWQRFPDTEPHYTFRMEWDNVAVLEIKTFEHWWNNQIDKKTRNMVRKSQRMGVLVRRVDPSEDFFAGVTKIYNETPIRQGRPFKHYGKTLSEVKEKFAEWLNSETNTYLGAYLNAELVGFVHLIHTDKYTLMSQILSLVRHWDKAVNNALIAKSVEVCAEKGVRYLLYGKMGSNGLDTFKRSNGFVEVKVPRYYIPLTLKGRIALALRLHHGWRGLLPKWFKGRLRRVRAWYYQKRYG